MCRFILTFSFAIWSCAHSQGDDATSTPTSSGTFPPDYPQSTAEYYSSIDMNAKDDELKSQLHSLINPHRVLTYDEVFNLLLSSMFSFT